MKLGKDEIKKIALSALLFIAVVYCFCSMLLGPLNRAELNAATKIKTLDPQIAEAQKQLRATVDLEKKAPIAAAALNEIRGMIPEGAPVAWFPPRMAEFFKRQGIDKAQTRLVNEALEKDLGGFRKLTWTIDLPKAEFVSLGAALAALENEEPLLQVTNFVVEAGKDDPQFQHATMTVATLVK